MTFERRHFIRLGMRLSTSYKIAGSQRAGSALTTDVSPEGVRVLTEHVLEPGTKLEVTLTLPDRKELLNFEGEVVWSELVADKASYGGAHHVGIRFLKISVKDRDVLMHYGTLFGPPSGR